MSLTALKKRFFHPAGAILPLLVLVLCLFSGCQSDDPLKPTRIDDFEYTSVVNNHLTMMDFAYHLQDSGLKVVQVQPIRADVLRATGACAILIDNDEIGAGKPQLLYSRYCQKLCQAPDVCQESGHRYQLRPRQHFPQPQWRKH